jgi:hypothetical protein
MRAAVVTVALALAAAGARADTPTAPAAAPSPADTEDVIGLLDVRVDGLSPAATEAFTAKIEQSLEISGLKVASRERLRQYLAGTPWNSSCFFGACLGELERQTGVATVIEVALATSGPSYHYVITLLDAKTGQPKSQVAAKCDVCTTDEAFGEAALAVVGLVNGLGDTSTPLVAPVVPRRADAHRGARRRTAWLGGALLGAAALAGAGTWYFFREDRDTLGGASAGAAGALGVAGLVTLGVSLSF